MVKMKDFLVSIIVPVYNCQQFLDRCIKSILNQSYKNIEVIVVNDGSSDNSLSIAESFAQDDSRMKVFTKENGGPSSSRNYGLNKVSGEFITFVDADDYIDEYMIENMIDKVNEYNDTIILILLNIQYLLSINQLNKRFFCRLLFFVVIMNYGKIK